jgi:hypothetical protein
LKNDKAIPGDDAHLEESSSVVNLAAFVTIVSDEQMIKEGNEHLVPLSSWDLESLPQGVSSESNTVFSSSDGTLSCPPTGFSRILSSPRKRSSQTETVFTVTPVLSQLQVTEREDKQHSSDFPIRVESFMANNQQSLYYAPCTSYRSALHLTDQGKIAQEINDKIEYILPPPSRQTQKGPTYKTE